MLKIVKEINSFIQTLQKHITKSVYLANLGKFYF